MMSAEIEKVERASGDPFFGCHVAYGFFGQFWLWRFRLHVFLKDEPGEAFHDHAWNFWTFPLRSYIEEIIQPETGATRFEVVKAFRMHYRRAEHAHRYRGRFAGVHDGGLPVAMPGVVVTLALRSGVKRKWFYWRLNKGRVRRYSWRQWLRHVGCIPDHKTVK
jgi:hypothetical protein